MKENQGFIADEPEALDGYSYQRADGTLEQAASAEEAIKLCPVLGKLAVESPDQAKILLDLAAVGRQKMAAEKLKQPPANTLATKPTKPRKTKTEQKPAKSLEAKASGPKPEKLAQPSVNSLAQFERPKPVQRSSLTAIEKDEEPAPKIFSETESLATEKPQNQPEPKKSPLFEAFQRIKPRTKFEHPEPEDLAGSRARTSQELSKTSRRQLAQTELASDEIACKSITETEPVAPAKPRPKKAEPKPLEYHEIQSVVNEASASIPEDQSETTELQAASDASKELVIASELVQKAVPESAPLGREYQLEQDDSQTASADYEAIRDERLLEVFDAETVEVFRQLNDVASAESEPLDSEIISEPETAEPVETSQSLAAPAELLAAKSQRGSEPAETLAPTSFEEFVASRPLAKETPSLETIKQTASAQSLEETLTQVARHLSETSQGAQEENLLVSAATEIEKSLPTAFDLSKTETNKFIITPELTEKLIKLLRFLGYQRPGETLANFVNNYDKAFLLGALYYMYQFNNAENRQEIKVSGAAPSANDASDSRRQHLGQKLSGLITKINQNRTNSR